MKKFELNKVYKCWSACDQDCIWLFRVIARTEKTVTLQELYTDNEPFKKRILKGFEDYELVKPFGSYSMAPTLRAENEISVPLYKERYEAKKRIAEKLSDLNEKRMNTAEADDILTIDKKIKVLQNVWSIL